MQKIRKNRIVAGVMAIAIILATVFLCVGTSYAYYRAHYSDQTNAGVVKPLSRSLRVYFDQGTGNTPIEVDNPEVIVIELTDVSKTNHLSKLRVETTFSGSYNAMMRIEIFHFWRKGNTTPSRANIKFNYNSSMFIDNLAVDNSFYYCRTAQYASSGRGAYILTAADYAGKTLGLISGLDQDIRYEEDVELTLMILPDIVQENRGEVTWGKLPTPPTP